MSRAVDRWEHAGRRQTASVPVTPVHARRRCPEVAGRVGVETSLRFLLNQREFTSSA